MCWSYQVLKNIFFVYPAQMSEHEMFERVTPKVIINQPAEDEESCVFLSFFFPRSSPSLIPFLLKSSSLFLYFAWMKKWQACVKREGKGRKRKWKGVWETLGLVFMRRKKVWVLIRREQSNLSLISLLISSLLLRPPREYLLMRNEEGVKRLLPLTK